MVGVSIRDSQDLIPAPEILFLTNRGGLEYGYYYSAYTHRRIDLGANCLSSDRIWRSLDASSTSFLREIHEQEYMTYGINCLLRAPRTAFFTSAGSKHTFSSRMTVENALMFRMLAMYLLITSDVAQ